MPSRKTTSICYCTFNYVLVYLFSRLEVQSSRAPFCDIRLIYFAKWIFLDICWFAHRADWADSDSEKLLGSVGFDRIALCTLFCLAVVSDALNTRHQMSPACWSIGHTFLGFYFGWKYNNLLWGYYFPRTAPFKCSLYLPSYAEVYESQILPILINWRHWTCL